MPTITSANSVYSLAITDLYPSPQTLQGYAADDAFSTDALENAEIVMGVDGHMSAGFVFNPTKQTITIMPDSPSFAMFQNWAQSQRTAQEIYFANATIVMPAIKKKYTLKRGVLTSAKTVPDAKKTLQAVPFVITWERITAEDTN